MYMYIYIWMSFFSSEATGGPLKIGSLLKYRRTFKYRMNEEKQLPRHMQMSLKANSRKCKYSQENTGEDYIWC